jgi:hypothetical protein
MLLAETDRLGRCSGWIDLGFVERERTPTQIIEKGFGYIWQNYHFRILNEKLRKTVSNAAGLRFITGSRKLILLQ